MPRLVSSMTFVLTLFVVAGCHSITPPPAARTELSAPPVRFLLSFDDGPSGAVTVNSTARILDTLAHNRWQPGIKAIFFVQTRHPTGGGTALGQGLMRRMHEDGHVIGLHSASPRGHINHTQMPIEELDRSLEDGIADIRELAGAAPRFLRPPYWAYNDATVARYQVYGLTMLLDDIAIGDGKIRGYHSNPNVRRRIHADLMRAARRIERGELPVVDDYIPLVMTLHDTNPTTARDLEQYLGMLIEEARAVGLRVHGQPFVSPGPELARVAAARGAAAVLARGETQRGAAVMSP